MDGMNGRMEGRIERRGREEGEGLEAQGMGWDGMG